MGKLKSRTARKYKPKRKFYGNRYTLGIAFTDTNEDTLSSSQEESRSVVTSSSSETFPVTVEEPGPPQRQLCHLQQHQLIQLLTLSIYHW